jgi:hypothetical protein
VVDAMADRNVAPNSTSRERGRRMDNPRGHQRRDGEQCVEHGQRQPAADPVEHPRPHRADIMVAAPGIT